MAFFTPSLSPAVVTREIDLTGYVPNVGTTTGVFAGNFRWGPVDVPTYVFNEADLVEKFASPDTNNSVDFHSAAYFSKYSDQLLVIRALDSGSSTALNAYHVDTVSSFANVVGSTRDSNAPAILNEADFDNRRGTVLDTASTGFHGFLAKYPGTLGNSLDIQICPFNTGADSAFTSWGLVNSFNEAPATSPFATGKTATNDEVHVAVVDRGGEFTGTKGTVLEAFPFVSLASNAKNADGSTNYIADVINNQSSYVWLADAANIDSDYRVAGAGTDADTSTDFALIESKQVVKTVTLANGANAQSLGAGAYATAFDKIEDADAYQVDFLIAPAVSGGTDTAQNTKADAIITDLNSIAATTRKDCIVVASPPKHAVINTTTPVADTIAFANTLPSSSYTFLDNNWLKVFDKYNDEYINIPAAASTAGLMAQSDFNTAPWFSPAGLRRGQYFGAVDIAHSPVKAERDRLYRANVNPIANIPGSGITLFGDKTMLRRPSAFDRINVRRLFLTLERAISRAAKSVLFEFNDEFTRAEFVNIVEPFLREVKGRRGITDFRVVCDATNNTPEIIDRNEFIATIFIKPARSINYITLNFVAVRTGVDFEEVVGLSF
jgi:phage tail sheath protein FI